MQCTYYEYIYGWFVKQETDTYMYMIYIVLIYYWVHHDFRVKNIYSSNLCSICVLCSLVYHRYFCIWICPCSTWGILYETQRSLLNLGYAVWNTAVLAQLGVRRMKHTVSIIINVKIKTDELQSIHIWPVCSGYPMSITIISVTSLVGSMSHISRGG
jgi:hypothetical protein